jgi:hypothetical protein
MMAMILISRLNQPIMNNAPKTPAHQPVRRGRARSATIAPADR